MDSEIIRGILSRSVAEGNFAEICDRLPQADTTPHEGVTNGNFSAPIGATKDFFAAIIACAPAAVCSAQSYADLVLADNPIAYWQLDDTSQGGLVNIGTAPGISASSEGGDFLELGVPGLADPDNPAMRFNGLDLDEFDETGTLFSSRVNIADNALTNSGGPYTEKTIELWFSADNANADAEQVIFEQGGSTRGITIYVFDGEVIAGVHNSANDDGSLSTPWPAGTGAERELAAVRADIESNTPYHLALVMDGDEDGFDGTITGYLNGESMGVVDGIGRLFGHTDDTHLGRGGQTLFVGGDVNTTDVEPIELRAFEGVIDDVALYNRALSAGRIGVHLGNDVSADLNGDGSVNFDDFLLISANFNTASSAGDVDFDEFTGMADFVIWRNQFDAANGAGEASQVPEPNAGLLAGLTLLVLPLFRRRCRRRAVR